MIYGLIGNPLGHSLSPELHAMYGLEGYGLFELSEEEIPELLASPDLCGVNVTIPYKRLCAGFCARLSPEAEMTGCVNTVVREKDGALCGYNTDVSGFISAVKALNADVHGRKCVIFGSGGASCAVNAALSMLGAGETVTVSRSGPVNYDMTELFSDAEIVVNATPLGMWPKCAGQAASLSLFPNCRAVFDAIYSPLRTDLLLEAEKRGIPYANGLVMLTAQAAETEKIFGFSPEISPVTAAEILRRRTENAVLIGMPGAGKTTVGRALAKMLGRSFFDSDEEIEKEVGLTVPQIFESYGEGRFRELERESIERLGKVRGGVISVGGGAVLDERNMISLRRNGRIYRIERDITALCTSDRPLSVNPEKLYAERRPLYLRYSQAFAENSGTPEETAGKIRDEFFHVGDF